MGEKTQESFFQAAAVATASATASATFAASSSTKLVEGALPDIDSASSSSSSSSSTSNLSASRLPIVDLLIELGLMGPGSSSSHPPSADTDGKIDKKRKEKSLPLQGTPLQGTPLQGNSLSDNLLPSTSAGRLAIAREKRKKQGEKQGEATKEGKGGDAVDSNTAVKNDEDPAHMFEVSIGFRSLVR